MNVEKVFSSSQLLQQSSHHSRSTSVQDDITVEENTKATKVIHEEPHKNLDKHKTEEIVEGLNEFLEPANTSLKFEFHDKLDEYYVTLIDTKTKEVVKEMPPKRLLDIYAAMAESLGFIVDHKI
ncbi:flagellar protein FlaG [Halobacillus sp. MO56]